MKKIRLKIPEGMDDFEIEEMLEKALSAVQKPYAEPNREFPDTLGNAIKDEANANFDKIINNMIDEITKVITRTK